MVCSFLSIFLFRLGEKGFDSFGGAAVAGLDDVAVNISGSAGTGVSGSGGNGDERDAGGDLQGYIGMAQAV